MNKLLRQKELAEKLSVDRTTIDKWIKEGLPYEGNEAFKRWD
jgi:predicted DNA-binding transcriptional regulator AlpA